VDNTHYLITYKEASLLNIIKNVKDKSKQISLSFSGVNQKHLYKYTWLYQGIHKFRLHCTSPLRKSSSLDTLHNIYHLILENIEGISVLKSGFPNVVQLELINCSFILLSELNPTGSLKEFKLIPPSYVKITASLDNIPKIKIYSNSDVGFTFPRNCADLELRVRILRFQRGFCFDSKFPHERLSITSRLHLDEKELEELNCYRAVKLHNRALEDSAPLQFPIFHGEELDLVRFSFSKWDQRTFSKLKILHLRKCTDLKELPDMPMVESLILEECTEFTIIPSLPSLKELEIADCPTLSHVAFCPRLEDAMFQDCVNLSCVDCGKLDSLTIAGCFSIANIVSVLQTRHLDLFDMEFVSLDGIEGDDDEKFVHERREVCISNFRSLKDFSFCKNIYDLNLSDLNGLISCDNIMNIHHLKVIDCVNLKSSKGLKNITGSVVFMSCEALTSIINLENIPEVEIIDCEHITDFSGLGNHHKLTLRGADLLGVFQSFRKNHPKVMKTIEELIVQED
jgi:hypothetical protein